MKDRLNVLEFGDASVGEKLEFIHRNQLINSSMIISLMFLMFAALLVLHISDSVGVAIVIYCFFAGIVFFLLNLYYYISFWQWRREHRK